MRRLGFLYDNIYNVDNIRNSFAEVCKNSKNNKKIETLKEYENVYVTRIYNILKEENYKVGPYNIFTIYEPKERRIVSQSMQDKIVNHLVARHILYPALSSSLLDFNVASRKNMGMRKGLELYQKYRKYYQTRFGTYYILKCDISKFFASINHDILKAKLLKKIKDKRAIKLVFDIIDSDSEGLSIGSMTSQVLAIFFLSDVDHFITEKLKIKGVIRYQDDFLLFSESKEHLKYCLDELNIFLSKEGLKLNNKTRLYKSTDNFVFIGRNKYGNYANYRTVKRRLKKRKYLYYNGKIPINSLISSTICYKNLCRCSIKNKRSINSAYKKV